MANVQKYFEKFHSEIRIDYDLSETLRNSRDAILKKIRKYLQDNNKPSFNVMLQGSYAMKTGVKPIGQLEYDIDVALRFDISEGDYTATEVRQWIYNAVKDHTNDVQSKGACIRVNYQVGHHVDLVAYAVQQDTWGKEKFNLAHKDKGWIDADPLSLLAYVESAMENFKDTEDSTTKTNQFRRLVRYLHRWDDVAMPNESKAKPCGLAFVLLVKNFVGSKVLLNGKSDDLSALLILSNSISNGYGRIIVKKPTPEYEDLFGSLTETQMTQLQGRFKNLRDSLTKAKNEPSEKKACEILKVQFGGDFPIGDDDVNKALFSAPFVAAGSSFPNQPIIPPNKPGKFA